MSRFEDHECFLTRQEEDLIKQLIDTGIFIGMRRRYRSWCMISSSHPESTQFFKSNAARRQEGIRHLVHHYYMIHPFSKLNLFWEFYMFCVYLLHFILIPIDASLLMTSVATIEYCRFILDILQLGDIIKLFFTGFYHSEKSKVILDCDVISKRYVFGLFFIDLFSSVYSYTFPLRFLGLFEVSFNVSMPLRILNRLKIFRMIRWLDILELFRQYKGYSSYLFKGIKVVLTFLVVTLLAFSINFYLDNYVHIFLSDDLNELRAGIFQSYYEATLLLLLVGYNESLTYVKVIFFLCFGFALQLFVYSQVLQVWTKYASAGNKHHSLHKQFKEYVKYKELPVGLRERIFSYFQFKFHKQFFKESDINHMVSPLLKQEIRLSVIKRQVEMEEFFKHLPENILLKVMAQLRSEIFLPGDVIINAGTIANNMFFVYHGTVAVYTSSGKEICHLEDGAHFGEIALLISETRVATVVAVSPSELYMLKRSDFLAAIEPFPALREHLVALATERLHSIIGQTPAEEERDVV